MLKLRKVELSGFKSFCEKTHLTFSGTGLSCIIGPNGCGKSNIVDAISWVLGEQSHKSLRAERMADCIFNGTAKRPPTGLAEVTLTLADPELAAAAERVLGQPQAISPDPGSPDFGSADAPASANSGASASTPHGILQITQNTAAPAEDDEQPATIDGKPSRKKRLAQKSAAQFRPGEVVISRRLYRSGQSEYLINGRAARLRDIQELFMGIGLGPDSYAIIEQGRIGQVLSSKPSDRRAIIEEAAGITKYKTKKRLAETKLEASKLNLSRVNDIYVEVEKQLASLKRQASKARRYAELREEMRGMLRKVLAGKAGRLDAEAERIAALLAEITTAEAQRTRSLTTHESEQAQLDRRINELDAELRQTQNWLGQAALELDRAQNRIAFNRQRGEQLEQREKELAGETERAAALLSQVESDLASQGAVVDQLRQETTSLEADLRSLAEAVNETSGACEATTAQMAELRLRLSALDASSTELHAAQSQAEQSLAHHAGALEHLGASERQLLEESLYHRERFRVAEIRWQSVNEQSHQMEQSLSESQQRLAGLRRERQEITARAEALRDSLAGARARCNTLEQILNDRSYTAESVQKLFASQGSPAHPFRAVGVLADYAEVLPEYEGAVEQFLRDELQYVVVETFDHARAGIALLRDEVGGRATFFVDSLRNLKLAPAEPTVPLLDQPEIVSRLDRIVEFRDPLGPAAKQFLPHLQSAFLVDNSEAAERLASEHPAYSFLTPEGICYQGRAVTGGRPTEVGPLGMKRELRTMEAESVRLERESGEAQTAVARVAQAIEEAQASLENATAEQVKTGKAVVAATLERDLSRAELARLSVELSTCQKEIARLRAESEAASRRTAEARNSREENARAREAAEREAAAAAAEIAAFQQKLQGRQEELAAKRAEKSGSDARLASAAAISDRLEEQCRELRERSSALGSQHGTIASERQGLASQNEEQAQQVERWRSESNRLEARQTDLQKEWDETRARSAAVDDSLRLSRQQLDELREDRSRHEIERARNDAERQHLRETCLNDLNAQPEDLIAEQSALLIGEELAAAESQFHEMKSRVEAMGAVNMMALEEYNECEQRFGFLGREREDLLQSIADTQQVITELDQVSRQQFEEAFAVINTHFAAAFQTLFGGGTGQMRLSEPDSNGEPGIDIAAQPLGKRLQSVLLLSGGERALTALALLIAIFRYQPSPFCILDEVDAPLDETNVGRFAQMLTEMSANAQFIVVTHNRRTMEMASVLYGVTMQEPGVSKLVSVNWDEARASSTAA